MDLPDSGSVFSATTEIDGTHATVTVSGEVDMATADAMYQAATRDVPASVTLDLTGVTFFDSAAIHALLRLVDRYPDTLTVRPSEQVDRVLAMSGLGDQPWIKPV